MLYIFWAQLLWWTSGLLAGLMLVGWIIIPVGVLAGWLLAALINPIIRSSWAIGIAQTLMMLNK
ncbi:MAG: hypothetical protein H6643_13200 [Caldilineaceae bacterium]|nr:hypothetical protein [Caldilineaceae bacterium]